MPAPFTFHELIDERATDPKSAESVFARTEEASVTYREYARASVAWAHLLRSRRRDPDSPPRVAVMMRNNLEFLYAYGGSAFAGGLLFGINTGLTGDKLRLIIDSSGADIIITDDANARILERIAGDFATITRGNILNVDAGDVARALAKLGDELGDALYEAPEVEGITSETPFIVVYTSGTTGLPKGVMNNHGKVRGIGIAVSNLIGLRRRDVGYLSMPLFHSNAIFLNVVPAMSVGASVAIREKFTASGFLSDVRRFGATFWNYVGQPVHYVMEAISAEFGGDVKRIHAEVRDDPRNTLRLIVGTGAAGNERRRAVDWLGLEHAYENYGSTEAEISTWCMPGDPIDSVGFVSQEEVFIRNEEGEACPPLELDAHGNPTNYGAAVGEIVKRGLGGLFQGYFDMAEASAKKIEGNLFRSGDIGAVRVIDGRRFLYFIGRTDDWIRKDGENFSAESVVELLATYPGVDRVAAYGVPHPVSDEWVMAALKMKPGSRFDAEQFTAFCLDAVKNGGARKWIPDFIRIVDDFEWTETHKIRAKPLKRVFFHPEHAADVRRFPRGADCYEPFGKLEFETLHEQFVKSGRESFLKVRD